MLKELSRADDLRFSARRSKIDMKHLILTALVLMVTVPALAQEGPRFFQTLNDVPLMPGLYELTEEALVFDKLEGRIAQSSAAGSGMEAQEIEAFYTQTLPQLGWTKTADDHYVRADETLQFDVSEEQGYNVVRFSIAPQ